MTARTASKRRSCLSMPKTDDRPPWVNAEVEPPDTRDFSSAEVFIAGALSTMPPFSQYHPGWALPFAAESIRALNEWMPDRAETTRIDDVIHEVDVEVGKGKHL